MKALVITSKTDTLKLQYSDIDIPRPSPNQVLVKIKAAALNPIDWQAVELNLFDLIGIKLPYTMGNDFSGVIEAVGANVSKFKVGDEIIGAFELSKQGAFAEFAVINDDLIAPKPSSLSFNEAAGIPLVGQTAYQALFDHLDLQFGQKILVQAAAGGVGTYAVQLAKLKGAYVVAVGSEKNVAFLKSLGADEVVDYRSNFIGLPRDFDAILDSMNSSEQVLPLLKKGGKYVSLAFPAAPELVESLQVTASNFLYISNSNHLNEITQLVENGKLKVFVNEVFHFDDVNQALEYQKTWTSRGKNILSW